MPELPRRSGSLAPAGVQRSSCGRDLGNGRCAVGRGIGGIASVQAGPCESWSVSFNDRAARGLSPANKVDWIASR